MRSIPSWAVIDWPRLLRRLAVDLAALGVATVAVLVLQQQAGLREGSAIYLLAVALVAFRQGSWPAIGAALGAFLTYNFLFIEPRFTFHVADTEGLLTLATLLVLGAGIGRLTGLLRDRARESDRREREARSLFAISRAIATARRTTDAVRAVVERIAAEARMQRVWIGVGPTMVQEHVIGDTRPSDPEFSVGSHSHLNRTADEGRSAWVRLSLPSGTASRGDGISVYRIELRDGAEVVGSLWGARDAGLGLPSLEETRLMAAAADQIGQGLVRDRLMEQANELEVTRRSDEMKAALLDSVSHDLRTPLGTIRAAAGTLADPSIDWAPGDREEMAREIDAEAERLARLVGDLLDMSRIEGGALQPHCEPMLVADVVLPVLARARRQIDPRPVEVELPDELSPVEVDQVLADQVISNLLENAARHTPSEAPIRISARQEGQMVRIRVEDGGSGVAPQALTKIFDKFYRASAAGSRARRGSGLGLALVRGLTEAMGGEVQASISELGGLAVDVRFRAAAMPAR